MAYTIEYKSRKYPYSYEYERTAAGNIKQFKTIVEARKRCIALIKDRVAVLGVVRGPGTEQLVYQAEVDRYFYGYVLENRTRGTWNFLNQNGTIDRRKPASLVKTVKIVQSAY